LTTLNGYGNIKGKLENYQRKRRSKKWKHLVRIAKVEKLVAIAFVKNILLIIDIESKLDLSK
jgi:hypothetical protein